MERKLGIDYEHTFEATSEFESLQTNQVQDGYLDLKTVTESQRDQNQRTSYRPIE
jgi:hypothetical protein